MTYPEYDKIEGHIGRALAACSIAGLEDLCVELNAVRNDMLDRFIEEHLQDRLCDGWWICPQCGGVDLFVAGIHKDLTILRSCACGYEWLVGKEERECNMDRRFRMSSIGGIYYEAAWRMAQVEWEEGVEGWMTQTYLKMQQGYEPTPQERGHIQHRAHQGTGHYRNCVRHTMKHLDELQAQGQCRNWRWLNPHERKRNLFSSLVFPDSCTEGTNSPEADM